MSINIKLNPFCRIRVGAFKHNSLIIDLILENKEIDVKDIRFLKIANYIREPRSKEELVNFLEEYIKINRNEAEKLISIYIEKNILVEEDFKIPNYNAIEHWIKRGWLEALIFHLKSKNLNYKDDNSLAREKLLHNVFEKKIEKYGIPLLYEHKSGIEDIKLPNPSDLPTESFEETLLFRRTHRPYSDQPMTIQELSNILYYSSVETNKLRKKTEKLMNQDYSVFVNSSFSSLEIYFFAFDVENLKQGLYHYQPDNHQITFIKSGDFRQNVSELCIGQKSAGRGKISFIITTKWEKYMFRYTHARAYRNILVNTGELAQKLLILLSAYKKRCFLTPAIKEEIGDNLLQINNYEEGLLYVITAG